MELGEKSDRRLPAAAPSLFASSTAPVPAISDGDSIFPTVCIAADFLESIRYGLTASLADQLGKKLYVWARSHSSLL